MIRDLRDDDVPGVLALLRVVEPAWVISEAGLRHRLARAFAGSRRRDWVVVDIGGEILGWACGERSLGSERDDVARVGVWVLPQARGRGLGSALYERAAEHFAELGARRVIARAPDEPRNRRFAERRGFRRTHTTTEARLDLVPEHAEQLRRLRTETAEQGFEVSSYADFADRPDMVFAVDAEASLDEPGGHDPKLSFDDWLERAWRDPDLSHEGSAVVTDHGTPVAVAELIVDVDGQRARNGFTGTLRSHRGRRLARLAKLASIDWAYEHGIRSLVTSNDETNAPMLALNRSLGYRPSTRSLRYVREER